jgi:hypothetical protein
MEYLAIMKNKIPFVRKWVDLESIMISEISHTQTNNTYFLLYVEYRLKKRHEIQRATTLEEKGLVGGGREKKGLLRVNMVKAHRIPV